MRSLYVISCCAFVLALIGVPVRAQTSPSTKSDNDMPIWKLVAIIVPSVVGGLTLLTCFYFCCCNSRGRAGPGLCGECGNCGDCGDCGVRCCDCGDGGAPRHRTVYSSSQGPIQVQEAYNYRSAPPPAFAKESTYVSNFPGTGPSYGGPVYGEARGPYYR